MRITKKQMRRIILEEMEAAEVPLEAIIGALSAAEPDEDVEAIEGVWGGDLEGKDRNLVLPIDHSKAAKSEPAIRHVEVLPTAEPVLNKEGACRIQVYRGKNDLGRSYKLPGIIYERYYDAYVSGNTEKASDILEEHLDGRCPGWMDYEWRSSRS